MNRARLLRKRATAPERIFLASFTEPKFCRLQVSASASARPIHTRFLLSLRKARDRARWWRT